MFSDFIQTDVIMLVQGLQGVSLNNSAQSDSVVAVFWCLNQQRATGQHRAHICLEEAGWWMMVKP